MSAAENLYRMLVLLEEPDKKSHEFTGELILPFNTDQTEQLNSWFDDFDEEICIPNEGHVKYEITSDGIIILILDKGMEPLVAKVRSFVRLHGSRSSDDQSDSD